MKLRYKKTGEIGNLTKAEDYEGSLFRVETEGNVYLYRDLKTFTEEWEDYQEESKGVKKVLKIDTSVYIDFATEEEAEKALEKLKAWTRLEEAGFKFDGVIKQHKSLYPEIDPYVIAFSKGDDRKWIRDNGKDLCLLFGGEE